MTTNQLLDTRERTHGDYNDVAILSQATKDLWRSSPNWRALTDAQRESLEMITVKIARLLCGNPHFPDHWQDIAGYAILCIKKDPPQQQ